MNYFSLANFGFVLAVIAILLSLYAAMVLYRLKKLRQMFFGGNKLANMEEVLLRLDTRISELEQQRNFTEERLGNLKQQLNFAIQKIGVVRFNPFGDSGGNLSFSLALLDAQNTGVVITSMHGREQNRIYTKKIQQGASEHTLTQEEQQAITLANQNFLQQNFQP